MNSCPLLAQSGHPQLHCTCPLSGVKRTKVLAAPVSARSERTVHSVTNQYRGFRVRQHLVRHTAEQNPG